MQNNTKQNPAPFLQKRVPHVPPPPELGTCVACKKWQGKDTKRVALTGPGQMQLVSDLIKQGMRVDPDVILIISHCAADPTWSATTEDHWCWNFEREPSAFKTAEVFSFNGPGDGDSRN